MSRYRNARERASAPYLDPREEDDDGPDFLDVIKGRITARQALGLDPIDDEPDTTLCPECGGKHAKGKPHINKSLEAQPTMNPTDKLRDIAKRAGPVAIAKVMVEDDRSYGITEPEMVRMITDFAKQQHPELTDAVAFSRIYCDSSEAGVILRKAVQITKNAAYEDAVDDSEAACAELSKIGAERWPSLTKAQQFARAAETNPALLAKAHRRPSIFGAFPHPTTKAFPRVNVDGVTLKPQMVTETSPTSPEAALAQLRVLGRQKWPTASESQAFINAVTDPTNADLVRAALGPPAGSSPPRITG